MSKPLKGFITYSHKDLEQNDKLKTHLAVMEQAGDIEIWDDNKILPGDEWEKDISDNLAGSDILLYLISATSLASKNCNKEFAAALKFNIRVIPIILEDCDWDNHQLSDFEVLPHKGKPINKWQPESEGWQNAIDGIRKTVKAMQSQADSSSGTSENKPHAELAFQQGNVLMMIEQLDMGIERYSHAIELDPNFAEAYTNRGLAYVKKGEIDRGIADHNKAIELNPDYADAYFNRGGAYKSKGDAYQDQDNYNLAIADFNKAVELRPDFAGAYNHRGVAYRDKGEYNRAIEDFNKAIEFKPGFIAEVYNNLRITYTMLTPESKFERSRTMDVAQINRKKGRLEQIQYRLKRDPTLVDLLTHDVDNLHSEDREFHGSYSHLTNDQLIFIGYISKVTDLPIAEFGLDPYNRRIQEVLGSRDLL